MMLTECAIIDPTDTRTKRARRTFDGIVLDVNTCGTVLGTSERVIRGLVAKKIIPYRRLGGRIVFIKTEIETWLANLSGCSLDEARRNLKLRGDEHEYR